MHEQCEDVRLARKWLGAGDTLGEPISQGKGTANDLAEHEKREKERDSGYCTLG